MTESSKAHTRFPQIDDAMVERAFRWLNEHAFFGGEPFSESRRQVRCALEAALDRRTGPTCRRSEYDDLGAYQRRGMTAPSGIGRRIGDTSWTDLPRKTVRLAREAAEEIAVSEGMVTAGTDAWNDWLSAPVPSPRTNIPFIAKMYRAMERVRREEQNAGRVIMSGTATEPVGGFYAPKDQVMGTPYCIHERSTDAPRSPGSWIRMHRRKDDEQGQPSGAPYGASIASPQGGWLHQRRSDTGTTVGGMCRHRRFDDVWNSSSLHRRKDDPK